MGVGGTYVGLKEGEQSLWPRLCGHLPCWWWDLGANERWSPLDRGSPPAVRKHIWLDMSMMSCNNICEKQVINLVLCSQLFPGVATIGFSVRFHYCNIFKFNAQTNINLDHFRICFRLPCQQILGLQKLPSLEFIQHWVKKLKVKLCNDYWNDSIIATSASVYSVCVLHMSLLRVAWTVASLRCCPLRLGSGWNPLLVKYTCM